MNYLEQLKQQQAAFNSAYDTLTKEIDAIRKEKSELYYKLRNLIDARDSLSNYSTDPAINQIFLNICDIKNHYQNIDTDFGVQMDKKYKERNDLEDSKDRTLNTTINFLEKNNLTSNLADLVLFFCNSPLIINGKKREKNLQLGSKELTLTLALAEHNFVPTNFAGNAIINNLVDANTTRQMYFLRPSESSRKASKVFEFAIEKREGLETLLHFAILDTDSNMKTEWTIADNDENAKVTIFTYDPKNYRFTILGKLPETPRDLLKEVIFNTLS
jgi:hypothetical protein